MSVPLAARVYGTDGIPLLLGSSLGTTGAMWEPQLAALGSRFRLVAFDHRGHGRSPVPPGPYTLEALGTDVLALADALGWERFSYAGLSLGGMVGMWLAAHAGQRVERLALLCTSSRMDPRGWRERAATVRQQGLDAVADAVVSRWFTPSFAAQRPEVVERHRDLLLDTPTEGYAGCCDAIAAMDLRDDLRGITAPTLVIAAADDPATPPDHAETIASLIPAARLEVLDQAAHLANVERPDTVTDLLLTHFNEGRT